MNWTLINHNEDVFLVISWDRISEENLRILSERLDFFLSEGFFSRAMSFKDINCSDVDHTRDLHEVYDFVIRCMRDASIEFSEIPAPFLKLFRSLAGMRYVNILIRCTPDIFFRGYIWASYFLKNVGVSLLINMQTVHWHLKNPRKRKFAYRRRTSKKCWSNSAQNGSECSEIARKIPKCIIWKKKCINMWSFL